MALTLPYTYNLSYTTFLTVSLSILLLSLLFKLTGTVISSPILKTMEESTRRYPSCLRILAILNTLLRKY